MWMVNKKAWIERVTDSRNTDSSISNSTNISKTRTATSLLLFDKSPLDHNVQHVPSFTKSFHDEIQLIHLICTDCVNLHSSHDERRSFAPYLFWWCHYFFIYVCTLLSMIVMGTRIYVCSNFLNVHLMKMQIGKKTFLLWSKRIVKDAIFDQIKLGCEYEIKICLYDHDFHSKFKLMLFRVNCRERARNGGDGRKVEIEMKDGRRMIEINDGKGMEQKLLKFPYYFPFLLEKEEWSSVTFQSLSSQFG